MSVFKPLITLLVRARIWLGTKRFGSLGPGVVRVSETRIIKGPCKSPELDGLKYVAQHTSIPIPRVHRTHGIDGRLFIEMEYIQGATLGDIWASIEKEKKEEIIQQIAAYIHQLLLLEPPEKGIVGSANLGPGLDYRVGYRLFGPFSSIDNFHSFLRGQIPLEDSTKVYSEVVTKCHTRQYRTCFTHADICLRNIIVRDDGVVVLVDWQFAGWYPEYWEFTKAHYGLYNIPDWYSGFRDAAPKYDDELAAERTLWERFDEPGMFQ